MNGGAIIMSYIFSAMSGMCLITGLAFLFGEKK